MLIRKNRVSTREQKRPAGFQCSVRVRKLCMEMCFKSALFLLKKALCFIGRLGEKDQWEPLRREECIRTVFDYYKGSQ